MLQNNQIKVVLWDVSTVIKDRDRRLSQGLEDFIRALRPFYASVLFSDTWAEFQAMAVRHWSLLDAFDRTILSTAGGQDLDASIFAQAVSGLSVHPSQAVLIDAHPNHVELARDAGLHGVHFQSPAQAGTDLLRLLAIQDQPNEAGILSW